MPSLRRLNPAQLRKLGPPPGRHISYLIVRFLHLDPLRKQKPKPDGVNRNANRPTHRVPPTLGKFRTGAALRQPRSTPLRNQPAANGGHRHPHGRRPGAQRGPHTRLTQLQP
uniref:(northern house mosquito) hypothetical protein n=2 Tax=Culex pipiens TaxID=7175 RepID=A0A8D8JKN2_CULPI